MSEEFSQPDDDRQEGSGSVVPSGVALTANNLRDVLQLTGRLHTARADPQVWRDTLAAFGNGILCQGVLELVGHEPEMTPDNLAAVAGRLTHCAAYGDSCGQDTATKKPICSEFAVHMHTAANAAHKTRQAGLFDFMPPTWIVDRGTHVLEANFAAKALVQSGECVSIVGKKLVLVGTGGARALTQLLTKLDKPKRLDWKDRNGKDAIFWLQQLPDANHVAVTALLDAPSPMEQAPMLAELFGLTPRQSELAAHLLADRTLAGAARDMGISRHTANEHLAALLHRTGVTDRKALLLTLRRSVHH